MIHKSYLIEQNIEKVDKGITLFYGENLGLINDFKELIRKFNNKNEIIRLNEDYINTKQGVISNYQYLYVSGKNLLKTKTIYSNVIKKYTK